MSAAILRPDARVRLSGAPAFLIVLVAYVLALLAGAGTAALLPGQPLWQRVAVADLVATCAVFVFSLLCDCSSIYDPYWSVAPLPIALWLGLSSEAAPVPGARRVLVIVLLFGWGVRLTVNWVLGWRGFAQEDWRYVNMRKQTGRLYWLVSLLGLHIFPTVTVLLGLLPLLPALGHPLPGAGPVAPLPLGPLDGLAALVMAAATGIETTADVQLRRFRRAHPESGPICTDGLWGLCRHPNYLGEILLWWGLFLFGAAAQPSAAPLYGIGAAWITMMFVFITIPMIDRRSLSRRPGYAEHVRSMHALLPLGRRREP